jgi:hypothetical protein
LDVDVVLKSLFMRLGELSDDICNRLDSEITMKVTMQWVTETANQTRNIPKWLENWKIKANGSKAS